MRGVLHSGTALVAVACLQRTLRRDAQRRNLSEAGTYVDAEIPS